MKIEKVGIGQFRILKSSGELIAYGLGSCIGLFLYDPSSKVGGLAHIMLSGSCPPSMKANPYKYAENAIQAMMSEMLESGTEKRRMGAILVGGAHMFSDASADLRVSIGQRNIEGVREILARLNLKIAGEDLGGDYGRTVEARVDNGECTVKSYRHGSKVISWKK